MINGFLIINKNKGVTSAKVVGIVKHYFYNIDKHQKIGHCGTLDPDGEGVLPIALGRATRLFDYLLDKTKTYYTEFTFGIETDTLDTSGTILNRSAVIPTLAEVEQAARDMIGVCQQVPPMYSAKSYCGKRAYDLARQGITVDLPAKEVEILDIQVVGQVSTDTYAFNITCSSGTYIRSIARDMGAKLGTLCAMAYIKRTKSGVFSIEDSITIEELARCEDPSKCVLSMDYVLQGLPTVDVSRRQEIALLRGMPAHVKHVDADTARVLIDNQLIALGQVKDGELSIKSWLNSRAQRDDAKFVLALGYFDGIHLGHQAIFSRAKELAGAEGWAYASIFPIDTKEYTSKSSNLFSYKHRIAQIEDCGLRPFFLPDADTLFSMKKDDFCRYIKSEIAPSYIVVGENFKFGQGRAGDAAYLKQWFSDEKTRVEILPLVEKDEAVVSSTYIKHLLKDGDVATAQALLIHPYSLEGIPQKGRGDGKKIGIPTFNLSVGDTEFLPKLGVYAGYCIINMAQYSAVINIGSAPTFGVEEIIVEVHVLDYQQVESVEYITVVPTKFLRETMRFDTKEELIAQIKRDMESVDND